MQQSGRVIDSCAGAPLFSLTVSWLHWLQLHWLPVTVQCAVQLYICTLSDKILALACITLVSLIALRGTSSARWLQFSCDLHQCCYSSLHTSLFYLSSDCIGRYYYYTYSQTVGYLCALVSSRFTTLCIWTLGWPWDYHHYHTHAGSIDSSLTQLVRTG